MKVKYVAVLIVLLYAFMSLTAFAGEVPPYTPDGTYYVDAAVTASGAGTSWATAFKTINEALTALSGQADNGTTAGFGGIIMVKPGTYTESVTVGADADLKDVSIMGTVGTDVTSHIIWKSAASGANVVDIANSGVTFKNIEFEAITGQTVPLIQVAVAGGNDFRFMNCLFDINAVSIDAIGIIMGGNIANTAGVTNLENCTFDMVDAGNAKSAVAVSGTNFKLSNFTMRGCTVNGKSANAGTANATLALSTAADTQFDGINLIGNIFEYATVLIQFDAAVAADVQNLKVLGNYFKLTDGVKLIASGTAALQFGVANPVVITGNHFDLNYGDNVTPYAVLIDVPTEAAVAGSYVITYNHIERTQGSTAGDASSHLRTANTVAGTALGAGAVAQDYNWWGSATGAETAQGASAVGAYKGTAFAIFTTANYSNETPPAINSAKGIEFMDVDNDGHLDKAVIWLDNRVDPGSLPVASNDGLVLGSGYEISSIKMELDPDNNGTFTDSDAYKTVAVYLKEMSTFDTSILPEVVYSAANNASGFAGLPGTATSEIASWTELSAAEVDKAKPVLILAETADAGYGTGTASNGFLDAIKFTFSEVVKGVRAANGSADLSWAGARATTVPDSNLVVSVGDISFNQGSANRTANTTVYTLAVGEVRLNTGLTPTVLYKKRDNDYATSPQFLDIISDNAKSATGADAWNTLYDGGLGGDATLQINVVDSAPLVVASVQTADSTPNGKIDKITVTFSENVATSFTTGTNVKFVSTNPAFGSGATPQGEYNITGLSLNGSVVEFTIDPNNVATTFDTEATPEFRYTQNSTAATMIKDEAGVQLANYGSDKAGALVKATDDKAKPFVYKIETIDAYTDTTYAGGGAFYAAGANGRIDGIKVYFSENVISGNGAQNGGTALDDAVAQFTLTHQNSNALQKVLTTAVYGKPTLSTDTNVDQTAVLTVYFLEQSHANTGAGMANGGDTGAAVTTAYGALAAANQIKDSGGNLLYATTMPASTDKAAPFVIQGIGRNWYANAFSNITTIDSPGEISNNELTDDGNGDGYIDGFEIKFSESILIPSAATADSVKLFTTTLSGSGKLTLSTITPANIATVAANTIQVKGTNDKAGAPDTGQTPALNLGALGIWDGTGATKNRIAPFTSKPVSDGAKPVMVSLLQNGSIANQMLVTFSEPVYLHYASTLINAPVDSVSTQSNTMFSYTDTATGGASTTSSTYVKSVTGVKGDNQWIVALDGNLTADDIASSSVWIKGAGIFDDINAVDTGLVDNQAEYALAGTNVTGSIKIRIMDDVVAPYVVKMSTVDANGNGLIDHIKFEMNEAVKDTSIFGYVRSNSMSGDVKSKFIISGYTGTQACFNFFEPTNAGKEEAALARKPVFSDNAKNDNILYLEIEEEGLPVYTVTGYGTTGYAGTLSYGTAPFLTDMSNRANALNTSLTIGAKGNIQDKVAPVLMKAEYANNNVNLLFSEAVADTAKLTQCIEFSIFDTNAYGYTFTPAAATTASSWAINSAVAPTVMTITSNFRRNIGQLLWVNSGMLKLTMVSDWVWPQDKALGIQLAGSDNVNVGATDIIWKDAAVNPFSSNAAAPNTSVYYGSDPNSTATWYTIGNKGCPFPYNTVPEKDFVGLKLIEGIKSVAITGPAAGTYVDSTPMVITWTSKAVDTVDVYVSYNGGYTFTKIEGSTTNAVIGNYSWENPVVSNNVVFKVMSTDGEVSSKGNSVNIISGSGGISGPSVIAAPADLVLADVPNDNGHWMYASFTVSADHLTYVKSYQFYRQVDFGTEEAPDLQWVYSAVVPAGYKDANGKSVCLVPVAVDGEGTWAVVASSGDVISDMAAASKEGEIPVAMLVDGAEKVAGMVLSDMSATAVGGAIDNIAPTAIEAFSVTSASDASGVVLSWTAPADNGIVGYYGNGVVNNIPIYGVDSYEVYRKTGSAEFALVGTAAAGSTSYTDAINPSSTVYTYYVKSVDSNPEHLVVSSNRNGIAVSKLRGDFTGDSIVNASDFSIFAANYGKKAAGNEATYVWAYDLNNDGIINASDFSVFAAAYGSTLPVAKAAVAEMPTSDLPFTFSANVDDATSTYFLNVNIGKSDALKGFEFFLSYDKENFEFLPNSVSGLVGLNMTAEVEDGIIRVTDWFVGEEFDGTVSFGFKTSGLNRTSTFEILNAMVDDVNGLAAATNVSEFEARALPTVYSLSQNYPNPFNPTTTIDYSMPKSGNVELVIFNTSGQKVRTLVSNVQDAGFYKVVWDGRNDLGEQVASGVYIYKLAADSFSKTAKMNLVK